MCQANDLAQRRHRAAYVAPSADLYPDTASAGAADDDATTSSLIPLLVEFRSHSNNRPVSPPSSVEWLDLEGAIEADKKSRNINLWKVKAVDYLKTCKRWFMDIVALVVMCFLGCFVYDVEVRVVKSNRRRMRERRVIVRNEGARRRNRPVRTTSLLQTADDDRAQPWGFV
mmetsp:Transcript_31976/g.77639  ORF Transcript_31976/g.77639 Transcript_31976/m.77639 type:complete len:171 (-) Transcript_31976:484-996(-)|eukprot:CAMPEP_0113638582 /NCGR_PEP_ID=MMETSP0017_2-20120614/20216_1 /TAXON_ID=2856 /ORGANISM="Cylindrotheca closterium" /LENGTH=170 /DNA_ID=CAMNT_0000549705 /DNA_START=596 /DNA_END=1108 /DNA_ORIENTATION=- /assembly_acc=CAM_ASM_000147